MKKVLALVVAFALCFTALAGCFVTSAADAAFTVEGTQNVAAEGGAATITIAGNYPAKTVQLLTVTIPAALTFDSVAGMTEYDETSDEDFGYIKTTTDTATVIKFLEVYTGDFSIVINVTAPAYDETVNGTYTINASADVADYEAANEILVVSADGFVKVLEPAPSHTCDFSGDPVIVQPTKDAEGSKTYTCECGETKVETIAIPTNYNETVTFKHDLAITSVVADSITFSTKHLREKIGADYTYFIVIDYQKYGVGHVLEDKSLTLTSSDRKESTSTSNKDTFDFVDIALYEMTLGFNATAYFVNGDGIVVGYETRDLSIASIALAYCNTYSSNTNLLTALADMCNYGDALQEFFSKASPDGDIVDAVKPSTILGDTYMSYASSTEGMPAAGEYNDTFNNPVYKMTGTGFVSSSQTLSIGATNQIYYRIRHDNYDFADIKIEVSYYNPLYDEIQTFVVTEDELIEDGLTGAGYMKYKYYFADLAIYACDETVTMKMYYNDTLELHNEYSLGNFVNDYISDANYSDVLTSLELFSNSVGVQLGLNSRWTVAE